MGNIREETARIEIICQTNNGKEYLKGALKGKKVILLFGKPNNAIMVFELSAKCLGAETSVMKTDRDWRKTFKAAAELADLIVIDRPAIDTLDTLPRAAKVKIINIDAYDSGYSFFSIMALMKIMLNPDFLLPRFQI